MISLSTTDNNLGKSIGDLRCPIEAAAEVYKDLSSIANTSVKDLAKNNSSLLVFPEILGSFDDGIEDQHVFDLCGNPDELKNVKLTTGNLMGFIGIDNTQLKISSRFSQDDENDFFLHYMLEKVFSINLFNFKYTTSAGGLDLLMFLFPHFLKKALSQGLFRQYQTFKRNDANVKGVIDVNRHIKQNVSFSGKIAYNSRERTFDNSVTQFIRHTVEFIKTKNFGNSVLNSDTELRKCIQEIIAATPSYSLQNREKIIAANLKPVNHPYFTKYKPLQKLCLSILRHKKIGLGKSNNKVYGILFDGAWLWEEYLATVLEDVDFIHTQNKNHKGGIKMFKNDSDEINFDKNHRRIYPDFYKSNDAGKKGFILDAKYKRMQNGVAREDLYQVVTYMHTMEIERGGFLYPIQECEYSESNAHIKYQLTGLGGEVHVFGIKIPKTDGDNFKEKHKSFQEKMFKEEQSLLNVLTDENQING